MFDESFRSEIDALLAPADAQAAQFPGEAGSRQPVHTVYVPADQFSASTCLEWGQQALALIASTPFLIEDEAFRVTEKLASQPIEDVRVDFEDGYGLRPSDEEDAAAVAAGAALAELAGRPEAPLLAGTRIKGLQASTRWRGLRTLSLLVEAAVSRGGLPSRFVVTLPKVAHVAEVQAGVRVLSHLESSLGLAEGSLRMELQIEVPQAVYGPDGSTAVARLVHAAAGRCEGLHYGTYDFSAAAGVVAGQQSLEHPLADHAKAVMQLAAAQTGVRVSDGSTNVIPYGSGVLEAWQLHHRLVTRSLERALYQGWDLHPGHLVSRYAATYAFYRSQLAPSAARLKAYTAKAASGVMDEPATAQALANAVLRALDCGACSSEEVFEACGLDRAELLVLARR
jgi:citrate lyase beta subunit